MLAGQLAFGNVQFFETERDLVLPEGSRYLNDSSFDRIAFEQEGLQVSVASQSFADMVGMPFIQIAKTQIQQLQSLVATQEMMNDLELVTIIGQRVLGQPEFADFIVGLEAVHQFIEALSRDQILMQIKLSQLHLLVFVELNKVRDGLVVQFRVRQVQSKQR